MLIFLISLLLFISVVFSAEHGLVPPNGAKDHSDGIWLSF